MDHGGKLKLGTGVCAMALTFVKGRDNVSANTHETGEYLLA